MFCYKLFVQAVSPTAYFIQFQSVVKNICTHKDFNFFLRFTHCHIRGIAYICNTNKQKVLTNKTKDNENDSK